MRKEIVLKCVESGVHESAAPVMGAALVELRGKLLTPRGAKPQVIEQFRVSGAERALPKQVDASQTHLHNEADLADRGDLLRGQ
jgi:hypothetical protein